MFVVSQFQTSRLGSVSSVGLMALGFHREHRDAKCMTETNTARPVSEYVEWLSPAARLTASAIKHLRKKRWPVFFQTLVLKTRAMFFQTLVAIGFATACAKRVFGAFVSVMHG